MLVLNIKQGGNFIDVTLNGLHDAEFLKAELEKAGFEHVRISQTSGLSGTDIRKITITNRKGGKGIDTLEFLREHNHVKMPERFSRTPDQHANDGSTP